MHMFDELRRQLRPFLPSATYQTLNQVELSRTALLHNLQLVQRRHVGMQIIPVLKSNAYGHGIREVAKMLRDAPCELLAVDGYFEAAAIRRLTRQRLLVLGVIAAANAPLLDTQRCSFVVQDSAMLEALGRLRRPVRVHVEVNTGMNRLGLHIDELPAYLAVLRRYPSLRLEGVMSHLADADNPADDHLTQAQAQRFDDAVEYIIRHGFAPRYLHLAQTAGSTKAHSRYANALRLGIGLYGISPLSLHDPQAPQLADIRPVLSLKSTIIKVIDAQAGETVGYNATFTLKRSMRVGVLPLGYYEGLPRALSNVGVVSAGPHTLPIIGRISMNHAMIDLGDSGLQTGDDVTIFSANPADPNSIARIARGHKLFAYGLLTAIAPSIRRVIVA